MIMRAIPEIDISYYGTRCFSTNPCAVCARSRAMRYPRLIKQSVGGEQAMVQCEYCSSSTDWLPSLQTAVDVWNAPSAS